MGLAPSSTFTSGEPIQLASWPSGNASDAVPHEQTNLSMPPTLCATAADMELDSSLMALIATDNDSAFGILYDRHCSFVYSIARRILESSLADECIHEVFMALWRTPTDFMKSRRGLQGALAVKTIQKATAMRRASLLIPVVEPLTT